MIFSLIRFHQALTIVINFAIVTLKLKRIKTVAELLLLLLLLFFFLPPDFISPFFFWFCFLGFFIFIFLTFRVSNDLVLKLKSLGQDTGETYDWHF